MQAGVRMTRRVALGLCLLTNACSCDPTLIVLPDGGVARRTHNPAQLSLSGPYTGEHSGDLLGGVDRQRFRVALTNIDAPDGLFGFSADLGTAEPAAGTFTNANAQAVTAVTSDGVSWLQNSSNKDDFTLVLDEVVLGIGAADATLHGSLEVSVPSIKSGIESVTVKATF